MPSSSSFAVCLLAIFGIMLLPATASQAADPIAIIVHPDLDVKSISNDSAARVPGRQASR